ncbi:hypothetical protein BN970_03069 [Mycolicibacterium conceptionense]|uniref:Uncharacterized protein n=1 Tax=Mycolicibacterium conceptionense TaxID=451644 RepID=A0A0U1DEX5_9MYCO|nr:hypothetical protein BN970_03069 [Mycolicibacterium conceptionense]
MDQHLGEFLGVEADWSSSGDPAETIEVISPHTEQPIARVVASRQAVRPPGVAIDQGPWATARPAERIAAVYGVSASSTPSDAARWRN